MNKTPAAFLPARPPLLPLLLLLSCAAGGGDAFAESTVTLFGVVDVSAASVSSGGRHVRGLSSGDDSTARLGVRGTEDIGGGLYAGFWLEGALAPDRGAAGADAGGFDFKRRATASLSGGFGEIRLGRDKVASYLNIENFDPFGDIGIGGAGGNNMIGGAAVAVGTPEGSAPKRAGNTVAYLSPDRLGGFFGQAQYGFGEQSSASANSALRSFWSLRGGYKSGAVEAAAGAGAIRGGTAAAGANYRNANLGGSYDFGAVKPMLQYAAERGIGRRVELIELGATAPLGPGELRAAASTVRRRDIGEADSRRLALGYGYDLSKRTRLYAIAVRLLNDRTATRGLAISSDSLDAPAVAAGAGVTGYAVGVRHRF